MRRTVAELGLLAALAWACAAGAPARAEETLPEATLDAFKDSTVFIKVDYGRLQGTGSGFLLKRDGDIGYLVTNAHVVEAGTARRQAISVVFKSARQGENTVAAEVVAVDPDRDLAILKVKMANLPAGVNSSVRVKLRETMPVYILGFPFGESLSLTKGHPAITVSRGAISSIRQDEFARVRLVQIDGAVNPGNSGGPIVDAGGNLVGIAVAKVSGTQIGFAIPAVELEEMLLGRISGVTLEAAENAGGKIKLKVLVRLINPMNRVQSVTVLLGPKEGLAEVKLKADKEGNFGPFSLGMKVSEHRLKVEGAEARGEIELAGDPQKDVVYYFQPVLVAGDNRPHYLEPGEYLARFSAGKAAPGSVAVGGSPPAPTTSPPSVPAPPSDGGWLGGPSKAPQAKPLEIIEGGGALAGEKRTVVDAAVTEIKLSAQVPNLLWSSDGKALLTLGRDGTLRRVAMADLKEERRVAIGRECHGLAVSREGLLVLSAALQELMVFDESSLKLKKSIPVGGARSVTGSPALAVAFLGMAEDDELAVADLAAGRVVKTYSARRMAQEQGGRIRKHKGGVVLSNFGMPALSPDGRYLFCVGFECLHRFSVNGANLTYEEMGPRIGQNPQRVEISADSAYVALPSGGGNSEVDDHPKLGSYGIYIYKVTDICLPTMGVRPGAYPRVLGLDKAGGKLYANNHDHQLIIFNPQGNKEKEYVLAERGDQPRQFLPHPEGNKLLVLTEKHLFWVELPK